MSGKIKTKQPIKPIEFLRADPNELAGFDPDTKRCTMNCGPHAQDPRSSKERKFLCDDCIVQKIEPAKPDQFSPDWASYRQGVKDGKSESSGIIDMLVEALENAIEDEPDACFAPHAREALARAKVMK